MFTGYIYKIYDTKNPTMFYIGSTKRLSSRKSHHKKNVTNKVSKKYWGKLYMYIRTNGGWDNMCMEELHKKEFESLMDLHKFEQTIIDELKPTLNTIKASKHSTPDDTNNHLLLTSYDNSINQTKEEKDYIIVNDEEPIFIITLNE